MGLDECELICAREILGKYKCGKIFLPDIVNILYYFKWKNMKQIWSPN